MGAIYCAFHFLNFEQSAGVALVAASKPPFGLTLCLQVEKYHILLSLRGSFISRMEVAEKNCAQM